MTIYKYNGDVLYDAPITESAIIKRSLMGDYYIEMSFNVADVINIGRGCYILHENNKFAIMSNVTPERKNGGYHYTLRFEAQQGIMKLCKCFWRTYDTGSLGEQVENIEVSFNNTTSLSQFAKLIVDNVNAFLGETRWEAGAIDETLDESIKAVSFDGDSCWDAVANIAETFDVEWWTEETTEKVILHFGKLENGDEVEFTEGDIVSSISYNKGDDSSYGTRFYVFGSTKNLPEDYSSTEQGGITNHISEKRLHLPNGIKYIDSSEFLTKQNIVEKVVYFDDIFPTNIERVTIVTETLEEVIEGQMSYVYTCFCMESPFTLADVIDIDDIHCTFTSGSLAGQSFKVGINATTGTFNKKFKIIPNVDVNSGVIIPNENYKPEFNDRFILEGVRLPKGRITEAENELLKVGKEYAKKNSSNTEIFECVTNPVYCHKNECNYDLGRKVRVKGRASRIQGYEKKLYDPYQASYSVGDNSAYSRLSSLEKAIKKSSYGDRVGLEANIIRSKSDNTTPSDYNVFSALASEKYFLHKEKGGIIKGETDFQAGIKIFGDQFYDKEKKRYYLRGDLIVEGGVAMYANGSDVDVPSIFDSLPIDRETIKRDGNGALYVDETALKINGGGGGGVADSVHWNNVTGKPSWIGSTKPTYKYSEIEERPDLSVYFLASNFTKANIKSTLGISDWALASAKPTYKYSEISNTPDLSVYALNTDLAKKWTQNDAKIANWDSAYSWGNHANAGYAKASDVTNEFKNYVKLAGNAQSITAQHNFANGLKIGGISLRKVDDYLYLDSSLVLSGGVTMYGDDGTTVKPIWESIPFDRTTIDWVDGKWTVVGGVGGGGISEEFLNVTLQGYQPKITSSNKLAYSLISGTPTKLSQLTDDVVAGNYLPLSGGTISTTDTDVLTINRQSSTSTAYIAFRGNGTLRGRFGFDASNNPVVQDLNYGTGNNILLHAGNYSNLLANGSINGSLTATSFIGNLTGNADSATKMSSFSAAPDSDDTYRYVWMSWSDNSGKPAYSSKLRFSNKTGILLADEFKGKFTGTASIYGAASNILSINRTGGNNPLIAFHSDGTLVGFLGIDRDCSPCYVDPVNYGKYVLLHSGNLSSFKLSQFTDDLGCFMTKVPADTLPSLVNIGGYGYENNGWKTTGPAITFGISTNKAGFQSNYSSGALYFGFAKTSGADLGDWKRIAFTDSNVASATKLATARTIWGQSFDGTGNITGAMTVDGDATFSSKKIVIGTIPVYESADGTLFVDANVVFRGGVAMYGDTTTTVNEE